MSLQHTEASDAVVTLGFFVRIEAKPGMEAEVEALLRSSVEVVRQEPDTIVWLALRLGPSTFAVVDAFPHEPGRQAHLEAGRDKLMEASELFAEPPSLVFTDLLAAKLP